MFCFFVITDSTDGCWRQREGGAEKRSPGPNLESHSTRVRWEINVGCAVRTWRRSKRLRFRRRNRGNFGRGLPVSAIRPPNHWAHPVSLHEPMQPLAYCGRFHNCRRFYRVLSSSFFSSFQYDGLGLYWVSGHFSIDSPVRCNNPGLCRLDSYFSEFP